ncbi:Integrase catalytic domain-containing protein, partial [Aphis craccivora]
MKACIVERFNCTLKEKMFREFTARGSHEWVSILPKLLSEYNNSKHRTIGMTPTQADLNPSSVTIKQHEINNEKIKFKVGDNVRIGTQKGVFTKGCLPNWSTEIFEIIKINKILPVTYQLQDYTGKPISGCFYSGEIHKTDHPNEYLIKKIIRKKQNQMLVNVSSIITMNVFGCSQASETKKNFSNLEQSIKSYTNTIDKIEQNNKSMLVLEEQTENLQLTCVDIVQHSKSQKTNKWLLHNFHQLSIDYGDIEYEELDRILNSLKFNCIYTKGEQKKQLLIEYIPHVSHQH